MTLSGFIALIALGFFVAVFYGLFKIKPKMVLAGFCGVTLSFTAVGAITSEEQGGFGYLAMAVMTLIIGWVYYRFTQWGARGYPLND